MIFSLVLLLGAGGVLIGFLLAVLGAGGSILLMPLLISGAALSVREAVPLSLLVVTLMALGNLGPYLRRGQVAAKPALILGLPALAGSWIGGSFVKAGHLSEPVQLGVFTIAALLAAWLLTRPVSIHKPVVKLGGLFLGGQGLLIGLLTGIAGVGGGFAIVPALVLLAGLPMQLASGTSLLLIALNSLAAMAALGSWPAAGLPLLFPLLIGGFMGALIGQRLAPKLPDRLLRRGFAALLVGSALLTPGNRSAATQALPIRPLSRQKTPISKNSQGLKPSTKPRATPARISSQGQQRGQGSNMPDPSRGELAPSALA